MIHFGLARSRPLPLGRALGLVLLNLIPLCLQAGTTTYTYDVHGRLTGVTTPNGAKSSTYAITYDNADNRTAVGEDTPPNAPTGLTATAEAYNWIHLTWNSTTDSNGGAVAKYNIYRGGTLLASATGTTYDDKSVSPNTAYTYNVSAVDNLGYESAESAPASQTTPPAPDTTPPTVPTNLQGVAVSGTQINLTWGASTDSGGSGLAGYEIFRNGGSTPIATSTVASYSNTGLTPYTSYTYTVDAYDGAGNRSAKSNQISVTTLDTIPPSAPGNPTFTAITASSATAHWTAAADNVGVTNYRYSLNGGGSWTAVGNVLSVSLTGLSLNTTYTMYVEAGDAAGNWGPASAGSFTTSAWYTDTLAYTEGTVQSGMTTIWGYEQGSFGSLSPNTTSNGRVIADFYTYEQTYFDGVNWYSTVDGYLVVGGFSSDPGAGWLQSIAVSGGGSFTGATASYSYSGGTATWHWPGTDVATGSSSVTIVHQ